MHEETAILKAKLREHTGSRYSKRIREQGGLPAIVYGHKKTPVAVTLDAKEAITMIHKGEKVYTLDIEGGKPETVLLRELQFDYLGSNIVHCDLSRVDLTDRVRISVAIHLVGEAVGLKKTGTILMHSATEIDLECTVTNLPEYIEVDVSDLDVGDVLHAGDVTLPKETMVLLSDPKAVLASITVRHIEEESTDESGDVTDAAAPEVITEKKDED